MKKCFITSEPGVSAVDLVVAYSSYDRLKSH